MIYDIKDTEDYFLEGYFDWIAKLLRDEDHETTAAAFYPHECRELLKTLFNIPFKYTMPMDSNRHDDGTDLRYRYAYENGLLLSAVDESMYEYECNMLEMMAALAIRIEEHIMSDPDIGDRTAKWFWGMIESMGLSPTSEKKDIYEAVERVYNRSFAPNGKGGLFTVKSKTTDLRNKEIWDQAMAYLSELLAEPYI